MLADGLTKLLFHEEQDASGLFLIKRIFEVEYNLRCSDYELPYPQHDWSFIGPELLDDPPHQDPSLDISADDLNDEQRAMIF